MNPAARQVLVCLRYGIGDVVMELPALEALRRTLPRAHITGLGAFPAIQLLEEHPCLDAVLDIRRWGITHRWDTGSERTSRAIASWLEEKEFDLLLDVHHAAPAFEEAVSTPAIPWRQADEQAESAALRRGASGVEAVKEGVRAGWGIPVGQAALPHIEAPRSAREFARDFLQRAGLGDARPLAISPIASLSLKEWPLERFARLADRMIGETGEAILAFCGPREDAGERLRDRMRYGQRVVLIGAVHLLRVAALLARCRTFVCNDTGLMHLAGAVGTPTVAIFGPTPPSVYRPPAACVTSAGDEATGCEHRNLDSLQPPACFMAGRCLLGQRSCVDAVAEAEVWRGVHPLLRGGAERRKRMAAARG